MPEVSASRLYVLRATYLFIAVGLGLVIWPGILHPPSDVALAQGVVWSLLGAVGMLAALGVRYPLRMLPVLAFELVWKVIWLAAFGLPRHLAGTLDGAGLTTAFECLFGVALCAVAIPWGYVVANYVRRPGESWKLRHTPPVANDPAAG